jgi:hypothetical protein
MVLAPVGTSQVAATEAILLQSKAPRAPCGQSAHASGNAAW